MDEKKKTESYLTNDEVREILDRCKDLPKEIYSGPEKDAPEEIDMIEMGEDVPTDPSLELSFEKRSTREHVDNFNRLEKDKAIGMIAELMGLERITDFHAYKIAELLPRDENELRPVFAKDRFTLEPSELRGILDIIDKYRI